MEEASDPISADVLNAAMESLGLPDLQFDLVAGRPVLRRAYDEMSLELFIGLLLTGIGASHLQRVEMAATLGDLEAQMAALRSGADAGATGAIMAITDKLRRMLTQPVLSQYPHRVTVPKLTVGPIEPDQDPEAQS